MTSRLGHTPGKSEYAEELDKLLKDAMELGVSTPRVTIIPVQIREVIDEIADSYPNIRGDLVAQARELLADWLEVGG